MNDKVTLLASGILVLFFVIVGLFDLLDNFIVMMLLFLGFIGIIVNILIIKSKDTK